MELFAEFFHQRGFIELKVNVPNISVFVTKKEDRDYAVILFDMPNAVEWKKEQCSHVEKQIFQKLQAGSQRELQTITFLCTNKVELVREFYRQNNHTAVIDLQNNRLLIFEGMSQDPLKLYDEMERVLQARKLEHADSAYTGSTQKPLSNQYVNKKIQMIAGLHQVGIANSIIIAINILVFLILTVTKSEDAAIEQGKLLWFAIMEHNEFYRFLTSMFLHSGLSHLFNNMLILAVIGGTLEKRVGKLRYCILYFVSGIIAGIVSISYNIGKVSGGSIGASGAIFGVIGAVLWIVLINKGRVENLSKRQMILFVALSLYGGFLNQGVDNEAHVGGLIGGFILAILIYRSPKRRSVVS